MIQAPRNFPKVQGLPKPLRNMSPGNTRRLENNLNKINNSIAEHAKTIYDKKGVDAALGYIDKVCNQFMPKVQ
ncbi:MAG: hypothetical protein WCK67_11935 [bacterium]